MFNERVLKEAFDKVKQDIFSLAHELASTKQELFELKDQLKSFNLALENFKSEFIASKSNFLVPSNVSSPSPLSSSPQFAPPLQTTSFIPVTSSSNYKLLTPTDNPTHPTDNPTHFGIPTDNPTVPVEVRGLKYQNFDTSIGNRGVPTDRQTNQQTDKPTAFIEEPSISINSNNPYQDESIRHYKEPLHESTNQLESGLAPEKSLNQHLKEASSIIDSLDGIKKEIRLKLKSITQQEMLIFSTIYQLEQEFPEGVEYRQIASRLHLSESSIRDYTQKLISKGIPVDKLRLNNKKILLKISPQLKEIAPLSTLLKLREL